jgi:FAD binding domain-containing protein/aromatic ring hydroxylase-like protein
VPKGTDWRQVDIKTTLCAMFGADVPFELISGGPWTGGLALVAEHYQSGPVFLAGDSAHLFTPLGGLGMNTGIGDVMNLGWKLAAVHQGWAGPHLLASYEIERRPIGERNTRLGVQCTRVMDQWAPPPNAEEDNEAAAAARTAFGLRIMADDRPQYLTVGIQLGERYEGSPLISPDGTPNPPDSGDVYMPSDRPGGRAPHFEIAPGRAVCDECGPGFTLLDLSPPDGDTGAQAFAAAATHRNVPLKIVRCAAPAVLYAKKFALIRPDHHIAWHGDDVGDALAVLDRARGAAAP